jgi:hypothetical protein
MKAVVAEFGHLTGYGQKRTALEKRQGFATQSKQSQRAAECQEHLPKDEKPWVSYGMDKETENGVG